MGNEIKNETVQAFTRTLRLAEKTHELEPLVSLFSQDASLANLATPYPLRGRAGTYRFWRDYLAVFESVETRFDRVVEADGTSVLEWDSTGILKSGKTLRYSGVTILEIRGDFILSLKSYYDSAAFVENGPRQSAA